MIAYVVESQVKSNFGTTATARVYVATESRAREICDAGPGRTYRAVSGDEMPAQAREGLERAAREA